MDESVVSAIAARPGRSTTKRPTNSAARCCASAALPPLPKSKSLPPAARQSLIKRAASTIWRPQLPATFNRRSAPSRREAATCSSAFSKFTSLFSRSRHKKWLPSRHSTCADNQRVELRHHRTKHFIDGDSSCRAPIVSPLIEELFQEGGYDLFLNPVIVNFPRARARKKSHALRTGPQRQMHWQTITAN